MRIETIGNATIHIGDCMETMRDLTPQSIHCCVTSPPYFGLRDYGNDGQIGLEQTPEEYVAKLVEVFREVRRVLRDDGTLFLNLGDSYFSGARRAGACDTSGKEPANYQAHGCLCGSLCGGCRRAYQIGKSHSNDLRDPTPTPLPFATSPGCTESLRGHLPTSGSMNRADHSEGAILGSERSLIHADAQPHAFSASTLSESCPPRPATSRQSSQPLGCLLCGHSLPDSTLASVGMKDCTCGNAQRGSASRKSDMGVLDLAYLDYTSTSLKPKDLIGIPWRVAFALQADGWYLRQDIIWAKPNPMPESVTDRCTKAHEYLFLLSKGPRYYFDHEAIKEPVAASTVARLSQNVEAQAGSDRVPGKTNGPMKAVRSKANSFKREGSKREQAIPGQSVGTHRPDRAESEYDLDTRNKRSVWTVATRPFKGAHFATFPPALIEPCILAGCPEGGMVLDPFGGAGTTGLVATQSGRDAVLCELNPEYAAMARERIDDASQDARLRIEDAQRQQRMLA